MSASSHRASNAGTGDTDRKIVCAAWIGRFGNRCHTYLYGKHVEATFGHRFYVPEKWEGSVLFTQPAPVVPARLKLGLLPLNDTSRFSQVFSHNREILSAYVRTSGEHLEFVDPNLEESYGRPGAVFSSLVTDNNWLYPRITRAQLRSYFELNDEVRESAVYRELEKARGTYDAAHLRRTDTAASEYDGGHSIISCLSYLEAFEQANVSPCDMVWLSDEPALGWKWRGETPVIGGIPMPWLPDFLKLFFARRIFRSNSAFSTWAAWLSDAEIYSPTLEEYSPGKEIDTRFVKGNHPHWMGVKGVHLCYEFRLRDETQQTIEPVTAAQSSHPSGTDISSQSSSSVEATNMIMMVHWNGRFGNRMFSFAFGRLCAEKFNMRFLIPSEWEGSLLFKHQGCEVIGDDVLRLNLNQSTPEMDNLAFRKTAIKDYGQRTGNELMFINPDEPGSFGRVNVFFDSLCVNSSHIFSAYNRRQMLGWFEWSDEVKSLDIYKRLEDKQGTYDIAHLRRDDISNPDYNRRNFQAYSVISKESYVKAFRDFGFNPDKVEWSTDDNTGRWIKTAGSGSIGGWHYPVGSQRIPDVLFDWLPDFLRLYFARTIFRSNSSFSWWAAFLSPHAEVFSPILEERKIYFGPEDEIHCRFVKGNHPHWLNLSSDSCPEIHIPD